MDLTERTPCEQLEYTIMVGLKSSPACLISDARMEECLRGMSGPQRQEWSDGFCRAEGLTAETAKRGVLFTRI